MCAYTYTWVFVNIHYYQKYLTQFTFVHSRNFCLLSFGEEAQEDEEQVDKATEVSFTKSLSKDGVDVGIDKPVL